MPDVPNEGQRHLEVAIFGAFLLLCAVGVMTVLLPEGSGGKPEGAPLPTSAPSTQ